MQAEDIVTPQLVQRFLACLAPYAPAQVAGGVPLGLHWCLAPEAVPMAALGVDGHAARGEFLPDLPLPRRMWAGGEIEFLASIHVGDTVVRRSRVGSVSLKQGRSGSLCFVQVEHELSTAAGVAIREQQDIVYREAMERSAEPEPPPAEPTSANDLSWVLDPSPVLLFRYSALTFNGHRIHYDQPYATGIEGYEGLVVHGPLQASFLLNAAAMIGARAPRHFSYRGLRALIAGAPARVYARRCTETDVQCEVRNALGQVTMQAAARW